jgi:hypothetical protein
LAPKKQETQRPQREQAVTLWLRHGQKLVERGDGDEPRERARPFEEADRRRLGDAPSVTASTSPSAKGVGPARNASMSMVATSDARALKPGKLKGSSAAIVVLPGVMTTEPV